MLDESTGMIVGVVFALPFIVDKCRHWCSSRYHYNPSAVLAVLPSGTIQDEQKLPTMLRGLRQDSDSFCILSA